MDISSIIKKETIFLNLRVKDREEVLNTMIDGLDAAGYIKNKTAYHVAVNERESKGTTGIGFGVAIPHGKSDGVAETCLGFARLVTPVEWKSFDNKPVDTVFMIAVPQENAGNEHLKILIEISKKLMHEDFRDALARAKTEDEVLSVLQSING